MTQEFDVEALGVGLRVRVAGLTRRDVRRLRAQWRRVSGRGATAATISVVVGDGVAGADVRGRDFDEVSVALRQVINLRAIDRRREDLLMFHAAGLADPATGDVIALIGASGAGKTTVASSLGTALGYVSDETVAVDAVGRVHAFPKPLAVKQRHGLNKRIAGPDTLGLLEAHTPLRLTRLALLDRRDEKVAPTITTVGLEEALVPVIEQTSYFASLPSALQRLDALVEASGGVHVIRYHDAADLVEPVSELLRRRGAHLPFPGIVERSGSVADADTIPPGSYGRAGVDDWIELDGDMLVLLGGQISRLSPLGSVLWAALQALQAPQPLEALVAAAEAAFGPAPAGSARVVVEALLDELVAAGLVVAGPLPRA
ncbi:hypothetical protein ASF88_10050 [Leifsonia sp. Leaf336]|uniref:hypothetical protein n=1 Tax=Leifsonia sp. Leaf336 TaxID=1736341 RepID=UPI0006F98C9D|nr:hypothetical protein [Leifsonia sp. Leaf336]KQR51933.1 hypothetical protein ASF88_10050 [Leifsonia sp. Leaf336]